MKCPHCKYVSFDFLDVCKKCGKDLIEIKAKHNIITFRPAFTPTGDAAFNIAFPRLSDASKQEQPSDEIEEVAADIPAEVESTETPVFEATDLTISGGDTADISEMAGEQAISLEEEGMTLAEEDDKGLLSGDEAFEGIIGAEEDTEKTIGVEDSLGKGQGEDLIGEDLLGIETIASAEHVEPDQEMNVVETGEKKTIVKPFIDGEPELELDMESFEASSMTTEEPTPPGGVSLLADLEPQEDQAPAPKDKDDDSEQTVRLTSSPLPEKEDLEEVKELTEEEEGIFRLDITEEDIRRLDENN